MRSLSDVMQVCPTEPVMRMTLLQLSLRAVCSNCNGDQPCSALPHHPGVLASTIPAPGRPALRSAAVPSPLCRLAAAAHLMSGMPSGFSCRQAAIQASMPSASFLK